MSDPIQKRHTTNYYLRYMPTKIWRAAKRRAQREGVPISVVIRRLLESYAKYGLKGGEV